MLAEAQRLVDLGYRLALLVERTIVLELKSVDAVSPIHHAELLSYLRDFNVVMPQDVLTRK